MANNSPSIGGNSDFENTSSFNLSDYNENAPANPLSPVQTPTVIEFEAPVFIPPQTTVEELITTPPGVVASPPVINQAVSLINQNTYDNVMNYQSDFIGIVSKYQARILFIRNYFGVLLQDGSKTSQTLDLFNICNIFKNSVYDEQTSSVLFKFKTYRCNVRLFYDSNILITNANSPYSFLISTIKICQALKNQNFGNLIPRVPICFGATGIFKLPENENLDSLSQQLLGTFTETFKNENYKLLEYDSTTIKWGIWILFTTNIVIVAPLSIPKISIGATDVQEQLKYIASLFFSVNQDQVVVKEENDNGEIL